MGLESPTINTSLSSTTTATKIIADDLEVDSGTLSIDADNNRVGVGTTAPAQVLDVIGTGSFALAEASLSQGIVQVGCDSGGDPGGELMFHTDDYIGLRCADSGAVALAVKPSGNVGIGDVDPGTALQLSSTSAHFTMKNTTAENTEGGCESRIIMEDHADNPLASVEGSHSGTSDDAKGKMVFATNTGSGLATAFTIADSQETTFLGTVSLAEAQSLSISTPLLPTTDHTSTGLTAQMLAGGTIGAFQTVCIHTVTDEVVITDSNASATMPVIGIAPVGFADTETGKILLQGFIRDDSWTWTIGGILYASETAGAMTQTAPTTSGAFVQAVGIALSADVVYFNPSLTLVEVA